jgi:hypothetical protein
MTQQEIQERNKQIQKMLGWELINYPKNEENFVDYYLFVKKDENGNEIDRFDFDNYNIKKDETISFHSDWNWLMLSVEFIQAKPLDKNTYNIWNMRLRTSKEALFIAVSDFAKLYNENKL